MEFWLYDHSKHNRQTLGVETDPVTIGRDDTCDIVLRSPFVARRHARIFRKGNQLFAENLGRCGMHVANREVFAGRPVRIDFGDEIQIAQFSLAPIRPGGKVGDKLTGDTTPQQLQARLMDFEQQVHAQLLERLNLRVTGSINKSDAAYVRQVIEHLEQILNDLIEKLDQHVIRHTVHTHLHRMVIAEVVRQAQGRVQTDYQLGQQVAADPRKEQAIVEQIVAMVDMMPLLFDPGSVNEDLAIAEEAFDELFDQSYESLSPDLRRYIVRRTVSKDIQDIMFGMGPLQDLLDMANVSEIMVVGKDRIYVEKNGVIQPTTRSFFSDEVLLSVIERMITPVGRRVDHSTPLVDARLPDGSRVNIVISPLSLVGPCITIRKFSWIPFTIDDLIERKAISPACAGFLQACIVGRKNIVISGGTGSGKTTLLNTLCAFARPTERIITIEESAELRLPQPHVVTLEARPANVEGKGAYSIRDLVRNALRMRPDRIIVGEVRGSEAMDMLQAMNTGHDGSLATMHANAPNEAIQRLEAMVLMAVDMPVRAVRDQIVAAIDLIVQVSRFANGQRRVTHITEVSEVDPDDGRIVLEDIFILRDSKQDRLRHTGYIPAFAQELVEKKQMGVKVFL